MSWYNDYKEYEDYQKYIRESKAKGYDDTVDDDDPEDLTELFKEYVD